MAEEPNGRIGIEGLPEHPAIVDGEARFLIIKVWAMADLTRRGSMGKQGFTLVPDGRLRFAFPVEGESIDAEELKQLMRQLMGSFGGGWEAMVEFLDEEGSRGF